MDDATEPPFCFVMPPIDADSLADWFDSGNRQEFCLSASFDREFVDGLCSAGFFPMAAAGPDGTDFLVAKLHAERAALDPRLVHVSHTAKRESSSYSLGVNNRFDEVLEACAATHGEGWLTPALRSCFKELFLTRAERSARFASFELYDGPDLVAGEIGIFVGAAYTSLTGYRSAAGAGTVQLAATGRWLEAVGIRLWDLGMPLEYKTALGARLFSRRDFLALFRESRSVPPPRLRSSMAPVPARLLVVRGWAHADAPW
jgi:Leu/Phe-tRNA-protein transferase